MRRASSAEHDGQIFLTTERAIGEWNFQEVTVVGHVLKVELNGTVILNADLSKVDMSKVMANSPHPGKDRLTGLFGFLGHGDPVAFRAIELREIEPAKKEAG